ncbi:hypothetical protein PY092_08050 [Muricauda sp. 334s03]|uniref:Uncharacterized protein n=1 Tax=Flagellimonas yonaguniensis TaxID=3031325 RepID=A0ABT5XY30_9FLAO|nr:hypothetical protein [[Muricauda] yonaguniensis]MDF0716093.1 hypothetical protein [[Muricauda] yonaguniensis]
MGGLTDLRPFPAKPQEGFAKEGRTKNPFGRLPYWPNADTSTIAMVIGQ